jgi:threonine/homoserine/homoserine lactone efflux protein
LRWFTIAVTEVVNHVAQILPQFALACLVLAALPGPATALFVQRAIRDGRAAGLAATAGGEIGLFAWALAASAGLTALLQANRLLFDALHIAGAAMLIYLGMSAWRNARRTEPDGEDFGPMLTRRLPAGRTPGAAFRASLLSIAANPKAAVFAFSFFPQFVPHDGPVLATTITLALIQVVIDGAYCGVVVLLAVRLRRWLTRAAVRRGIERVLAAVLIGLGLQLAIDR